MKILTNQQIEKELTNSIANTVHGWGFSVNTSRGVTFINKTKNGNRRETLATIQNDTLNICRAGKVWPEFCKKIQDLMESNT